MITSPSSSSSLSIRMTTTLLLLFTVVVSVAMIIVPWLPFQQQQQQYTSVYVSSFQLLPLQRHLSPYHHYDDDDNNNNKRKIPHHSCIALLAVDTTNNKALIVNTNDDDDDDDDITATVPVPVPVSNNNKYTQKWEENFALLKQYYQREGHYNIPSRHEEDGKKLSNWVRNQRGFKKSGKLLTEREKKLNDLDGCDGNDFLEYIKKQVWEDNFSALVRYKQREGHCYVPAAHQEDNKKLGRWLQTQRSNKSTGKLHGRREQRLLDLGVVLDNVTSNRWDDHFALLCEYKQSEGHCNVPRWYQAGDGMNKGTRKIFLGRWVSTQKTMKNGNKLDSARQQKLEDIGFLWAVPRTIFWDDYFLLLKEYKSREGHCTVPIDHKEDGKNLGKWLVKQRQNESKNKLDSTRKKKLNQLGVKWQVSHKQSWEDMYSLLVQYQKREGTCTIKIKHKEDGKNLGTWLYSQRQKKRIGTLNIGYLHKLEEIGVVFGSTA